MSNQVPPGPGPGSEPPYGPYSSQGPGVPPPPGPYQPGSYSSGGPTGAPPPSYGQGSYGAAPQPYGPSPEQPSYGYSPQQPAYGAGGGYQAGGQYPPGGYAPSYQQGAYPAAPQGGSGGKIVAIVAAAVIVVGLVIGGVVVLLNRGGSTADGPSTAPSSHTPSPKPTTTRPRTPSPTPSSAAKVLSDHDSEALAQAAFPLATGYQLDYCTDGIWTGDYNSVHGLGCKNTAGDHWVIYTWNDTATALRELRSSYRSNEETTWAGGVEFQHDGSGIFYKTTRCYADAPVCVEVFEDTKDLGDAVLGHLTYLDASGVAALNDKVAGGGV